jgi:alpha-mannosidase
MSRKDVHVFPHFHYDVVFQKTYDEYLDITFDVLKKALSMMEKVKDYTFGVEQTLVLEEFLRRHPDLKKKVAEAVKSGRMEITCGMYVMPDMNLPSGESLIRQTQRGRDWLWNEFGVAPRVCMITDCFGHHRQLPQILKQCGYEYFIFSRGMVNLGPSDFWWKGIDGTRMMTHWNYRGYGSAFSWILASQKNWTELKDSICDIAAMSVTDQALILLGGDFCPPVPHSQEVLEKITDRNHRAFFSTLTNYMDNIKKKGTTLKTIDQEFNPMMEGCYSSRIGLKQENRFLESEIGTLEKLCVLVGSKARDTQMLKDIWKPILINQFHDTICGSIIDQADAWAKKLYQGASRELGKQIPLKLKRLTSQIAGKGEEQVVSAFNPTCCTGPQVVSLDKIGVKAMVDAANRKIPVQSTKNGTFFVDRLPSLGLKTYRCINAKISSSLKVSCDHMENPFYKLRITNGVISSLVDKTSGKEFVNPELPVFNTLALQKDDGDSWLLYNGPLNGDTWKPQILADPMPASVHFKQYFFAKTKHSCPCDRTDYQKNKIEIIERGPVRAGLKISGTLTLNESQKVPYEQYIYLYENLRRIDFAVRIFPSGRQYRLRSCFATLFKKPRITHEIPFGVESRVSGEFPALNWVNYVEKKQGLLVLNKGLPGNNFQDGVAMISLFRSVAMEPVENSKGSYLVGQDHFFEYAVIPYTSQTPISPAMEGMCYNTRVPAVCTHSGSATERSFLQVTPANIMVSGFYQNGNGLVIRIYESEGRPAQGSLKLTLPIVNVNETDCVGNVIHENLPLTKNQIILTLKPFEIKTFLVTTEDKSSPVPRNTPSLRNLRLFSIVQGG